MRNYINYLESLKVLSKNKKEIILLTHLIEEAEKAFSKELWDKVPLTPERVIQGTPYRNDKNYRAKYPGMSYID